MSEIKDKYREETNKDIFAEPQNMGSWCYSCEYVQWLENQIKLLSKGITIKMQETETFVRQYINNNGYPPTYRVVAKKYNIYVCAAYARLRHCRKLMKHRNIDS